MSIQALSITNKPNQTTQICSPSKIIIKGHFELELYSNDRSTIGNFE